MPRAVRHTRPMPHLRPIFVVALVLLGLAAPTAHAQYESDPFDPLVARDAWYLISRAEQANQIPAGLLHAMSLVETGQGMRGWVLPWPYTIGVNGTGTQSFGTTAQAQSALQRFRSLGFARFTVRAGGTTLTQVKAEQAAALLAAQPQFAAISLEGHNFARRFANASAAETFVGRMLASGYRNMDVGMMQINWRVHSGHFRSVAQAIEPNANVAYAVRYLLEHRQTRDWWGSVGRYHSATRTFASKYVNRVYSMYRRIHRLDVASSAPTTPATTAVAMAR